MEHIIGKGSNAQFRVFGDVPLWADSGSGYGGIGSSSVTITITVYDSNGNIANVSL